MVRLNPIAQGWEGLEQGPRGPSCRQMPTAELRRQALGIGQTISSVSTCSDLVAKKTRTQKGTTNHEKRGVKKREEAKEIE